MKIAEKSFKIKKLKLKPKYITIVVYYNNSSTEKLIYKNNEKIQFSKVINYLIKKYSGLNLLKIEITLCQDDADLKIIKNIYDN